jgi:hypothetical protein
VVGILFSHILEFVKIDIYLFLMKNPIESLPHYFFIGLIFSYSYAIVKGLDSDLNISFQTLTASYLGWLNSQRSKDKAMGFVLIALFLLNAIAMILYPVHLTLIFGLLTSIGGGWFSALSFNKNKEEY